MMNAVGRFTRFPPRSTSVCANVAMTPARMRVAVVAEHLVMAE